MCICWPSRRRSRPRPLALCSASWRSWRRSCSDRPDSQLQQVLMRQQASSAARHGSCPSLYCQLRPAQPATAKQVVEVAAAAAAEVSSKRTPMPAATRRCRRRWRHCGSVLRPRPRRCSATATALSFAYASTRRASGTRTDCDVARAARTQPWDAPRRSRGLPCLPASLLLMSAPASAPAPSPTPPTATRSVGMRCCCVSSSNPRLIRLVLCCRLEYCL